MVKLTMIAFFTLWTMSNYEPVTDAERMGLKAKVKSMTETMFFVEPNFTFKETSYFDEKGNLTRRQFYEYHIDFDGTETTAESDYESYQIVSPELTTYSIFERGRITKEGEIARVAEYKFIRKENEFGTYQQEIVSEYNSKWELIHLHRKALVNGDSTNIKMNYNYKKGELKTIHAHDLIRNEKSILELKNHQYDKHKNLIFVENYEDGKLLYTSTCEMQYHH
ncbi:MAG: hypothetical protein WCY25_02595 [Moheibacter sp.]